MFGDGGLHLIDIDTPTKKVVRYRIDIDVGKLSECETIVDLGDLDAFPDGMVLTPDEQSLIISFYNPNPVEMGETRQYSLHTGALEQVWFTPQSPQATCPLLLEVASGIVKLVITTAVEHMPLERQEKSTKAGGIFIADTNFATSPSTPCFPVER